MQIERSELQIVQGMVKFLHRLNTQTLNWNSMLPASVHKQ